MKKQDYIGINGISGKSLVQAVKVNDEIFLKNIYLSNYDKFRQYAFRHKGKEEHVENIYQQSFTQVWRDIKREEFLTEDLEKLSQYLFQIAKQNWAAHRRAIRYKHTIFINRELEIEEISEEEELLNERMGEVVKAFENLQDTCQQLLEFYYFKRKGFKEISELLSLGEVAVYSEKYNCQEELFKHVSFLQHLPQQVDQQQIDDYLLDRIDPDDLIKLGQKIIAYPEFEDELEAQRILVLGVEELHLKKMIKLFHEDAILLPLRKFHKKAWIALGISMLLLISVSIWAIFYRSPSSDILFSTHFIPDPGMSIPTEEAHGYMFYSGMENYMRGEFAESIHKWEPLYAAQPDNDTLLYFLGVANLAVDNSRSASKYLEQAQKMTTSVFYEEAQYYYALSLIKQNRLAAARSFLRDSDCSQCKELLSELGRGR